MKNIAVKNGIILGLLSVLYSIILYFVNPKWMFTGVAYLGFILIIYYMYRAAVEERKKNEGILTFGEAIKATFLTYVIATFISSIFLYVIFIIDPSLNEVMRQVAVDSATYFTDLMGADVDVRDQVQDQLNDQVIEMTLSMAFLNYLVALIFPGFILALIISAFTKKES